MHRLIERARTFLQALCRDLKGVILPYAALLLSVLVGLAGLAMDVGRQVSLQTQLQAVADALALAGARELNQASDAQTRATNAINNLVSNGVTGLGYNGSLSYTITFYSALESASVGFGGTAATSGTDSKYVGVSLTQTSISSTFYLASSTLGAGAQAIAGFQGTAACGISPIFICNPYETSGMTDTQATAALHAALDPNDPNFDSATLQKMFRMNTTNTSPGHFGWLQPPDTTCNNTNCLNDWVSRDTKSALVQACYDQVGVKMATGNKPLQTAFDDRFDIYDVNGPSSSYSPAINVRKGYIPDPKNGDVCSPQAGDYLGAQGATTGNNGAPSLATATATNNSGKVTNVNSFTVTGVFGTIQNGMSIALQGGGAALSTVQSISGTTVTVPNKSKISLNANDQLQFLWLTAPLPLDSQWTGVCSSGTCLQGNGNWDCLDYWNNNHTGAATAAPPGCTSSNPSVSRYQVYLYENSNAGDSPAASPITDYSGYPRPTQSNGESGAPLCAKKKGFTPTFDSTYDQRIIYTAVINCDAQAGAIGGGNSGGNVPVAGFAKFFLTQPYNSDTQQYLYGEMTGLVNQLSASKIYNQVQLYR